MKNKVTIIPMTILLCIIMLTSLTPPALAQTTNTNQPTTPTRNPAYIARVVNTTGTVVMPNNIVGPFDGCFAYLMGTTANPATIIGQMNTQVAAGSTLDFRAYSGGSAATTSYIIIAISNSPHGPWIIIVVIIVNTTATNYTVPNVPSFGYISVTGYNTPGNPTSALYVDGINTY